jgi:hypothetical protein
MARSCAHYLIANRVHDLQIVPTFAARSLHDAVLRHHNGLQRISDAARQIASGCVAMFGSWLCRFWPTAGSPPLRVA